MDKVLYLIKSFHPYDTKKNVEKAFCDAMNESFDFHYKNNKLFRLNADRFKTKYLTSYNDLKDYPYFFVNLFKSKRMCSVPTKKIKIRLSSSGTGGKKSYHYLDDISLMRIKLIVNNIFSSFNLTSKEKFNYLCFTYDPKKAKNIGTAFSDKLLTTLTHSKKIFYALKFDKKTKEFVFDEKECLDVLKKFEKSGLPLRILGFPAYIWKVLSEYKGNFKFPENSAIITGGGWKLHTGEEVPKPIFKEMIANKLGISPHNIRDTFGMVEHGIPYLDCEYHNFHIPIYSYAIVRDPLTLKPLDYGEEGILHLFTPYMHSFPAISLLTTDKVIMEINCPCGRKTPFFNITGRGGIKKHKGCAIKATELLLKNKE